VNGAGLEMEVKSTTDSLAFEALLKQLWEKIRSASEKISELKQENEASRARMEHLEHEVDKLRSDLIRRDQEIVRLKQDHSQLSSTLSDNNVMTPDEKEALKERIRELIAKINSHL